MSWEPMDTAPRDGTPIRLYAKELEHGDFNPSGSVEGFWLGDEGWIGAVWNDGKDDWQRTVIHPTFWMELPKPPAWLGPGPLFAKEKQVIKFLRTDAGAVIPTRGSDEAAGFDLYSPTWLTIPPSGQVSLNLNICSYFPPGHVCLVRDRSGNAKNRRLTTRAGVIDSDYRGEWQVILVNEGDERIQIEKGHKVAQFLLLTLPNCTCSEISSAEYAKLATGRGKDGFGSTDNAKSR